MRQLEYGVPGKAGQLRTYAVDEPGTGGACHVYQVVALCVADGTPKDVAILDVQFQNGPISADGNGINGVQNEDLLAMVLDRLRGFQQGPFACEENQLALVNVEAAIQALESRTRKRIERGVEGKLLQ